MWETGTPQAAAIVASLAAHWLEDRASRGEAGPLVLGICGAQGIGKSTLSGKVVQTLEQAGWRVMSLSLDDLYLGRAERAVLARTVHPLLATRGVPGTHDVALGLRVLDAAGCPGRVAVPRFDKALDDRKPASQWPIIETPVDLVVIEGWCIGAIPQDDGHLAEPVNALERDEDAQGIWRRYVNDRLAGPYRELFGRIDLLVLLAAPSFDIVAAWRGQQERELAEQLGQSPGAAGRAMTQAEIERFVQHYERLTRHILGEMPGRADLVIRLDEQRQVIDQATRSRGDLPSK